MSEMMADVHAAHRPEETPPRIRWHRPLLWLAAVMAALAVFALVARFVDEREVLGANLWDKPLKFAISTVIYAVTWSWLIGQLERSRRVAWASGTVIAAALVVELAIIVSVAAAGTTSHFNVSTPLATAMWSVMAVSISVLWVATFVACILLFRTSLGDRARTIAIRGGALISLVGLGLGYLMTSPTAAQLADFGGIAGAHAVGVADGGPGLPVLGWSTVAGDLRIPHFIGMHALQAIPLALIAIELLSRRTPVLRDVAVRARLVGTVAVGYLAFVGLVTLQALRGQSVVAPDAVTLGLGGAIAVVMAAAALVVVAPGRTRAT
ncbi:heme exporter protein D [Marisediminicola sp. UYEF4]